MDTDDHGLFLGEVIRGNPRESAASVPQCLRGEGWLGGLGRSPFQGSGLMGVPLTQAVGLGFVISPLWGCEKTRGHGLAQIHADQNKEFICADPRSSAAPIIFPQVHSGRDAHPTKFSRLSSGSAHAFHLHVAHPGPRIRFGSTLQAVSRGE
jgi:hypothetical protein